MAMRDGGGKVDPVTPYDGGRMTFPGQGGLPADVPGLAPLDRRVCPGGDPGVEGSPPLGPVTCVVGPFRYGVKRNQGEGK